MPASLDQEHLDAQNCLAGIDWHAAAVRMGVMSAENGLLLPFFGDNHRLSNGGCFAAGGRPATVGVAIESDGPLGFLPLLNMLGVPHDLAFDQVDHLFGNIGAVVGQPFQMAGNKQ